MDRERSGGVHKPLNHCDGSNNRAGQGCDGQWMLKLIYPHALSLEAYLEHWLRDIAISAPSISSAAIESLGGALSYLVREDDGPEFKQLLKETLVAYQPPAGGATATAAVGGDVHARLPRHASLHNRSSMADLLDRVVKSLLRSSSVGQGSGTTGGFYAAQGGDPRRNVLSLGCRVAGPQASSELLSVHGVACAFPNTTVNIIRSRPWELLLSRIGDDLMFALLRQHTLLLRMPNRCYMQLAGRPVPDICRHLGLTSATTLNSSGGVASLRSTNTQGQNKRKNSTSGNCGSGKSSIVDHPRPRGNMGSHGDGEPQPSAATSGGSVAQGSRPGSDSSALNVPTAAASTARDRGSDTTRVPGVLFDPGVPLGTDKECRPGSAVRATVKKRGRTAPLVLLPRHRIFYSSTFVRKAGLPRGHPLNPSFHSTRTAAVPAFSNPTPRGLNSAQHEDENDSSSKGISQQNAKASEDRKAACCLLMDVFCRQTAAKKQSPGADSFGQNGHRREAARGGTKSGAGRHKLPKRLRRALPMFEEMMQRASRCNFGRLLEVHCPLPAGLRSSRKRCSQSRVGESATTRGRLGGNDGVGTLPTNGGTPPVGDEDKWDTFVPPTAFNIFASQETAVSKTSTEKDMGFEGQTSSAMLFSQGDDIDGRGDGEVRGEMGQEDAAGSDCASVGDDVAFQYSVSSSSLPTPTEAAHMDHRDKVSLDVDGGHDGEDIRDYVEAEWERPAKRRRRWSVDHGAERSVGTGGYQGAVSGIATDSVASSEHDDGASEVTVLDVGAENDGLMNCVDEQEECSVDGNHRDLCNAKEAISPSTEAATASRPVEFGADCNFIEMASAHRQVVDFLCQACHRVFPTALWGSKRNMVCLFKAVERFVVLRRHENMTVLEVTAGMRTSDLEWMSPISPHTHNKKTAAHTRTDTNGQCNLAPLDMQRHESNDARQQCDGEQHQSGTVPACLTSGKSDRRREGGSTIKDRSAPAVSQHNDGSGAPTALQDRKTGPKRRGGGGSDSKGSARRASEGRRGIGRRGRPLPPSDLAKRTDLLEALVYWTFNDFLVPLLRSLFYVTECETASQEVFFFRKPVWAKFRTVSLRHLTSKQYRRITAQEALFSVAAHTVTSTAAVSTGGSKLHQDVRHGNRSTSSSSNNSNSSSREQDRGGRGWSFPVSGVRLVPKAKGVRAIANLSKRVWADRDRVQWVKGVPLPAPRRLPPALHRTTSNPTPHTSSAQLSNQGIVASFGGGKGFRRTFSYPGSGQTRAGVASLSSEGVRARRGVTGGVAGACGAGGSAGNGSAGVLLPSTNMQLSNAFHVLKHEYLSKPSLVGAGVFGLDDVFAKIKPFVARNLRSSPLSSQPQTVEGGRHGEAACDGEAEAVGAEKGEAGGESIPSLFFASVDIKHCYDTVDQAKLMKIIRPVVASEDYVVQKYSKTHPFKAMGRVQVSHAKEAVAMEDMPQFRLLCEGLAAESVDTIFTDQVVYGTASKDEVLEMIEDHITNNIVRVPAAGGAGKDAFFRQAVGIPQGSVLSGLLCNYFFGHIEKCLLRDVLCLSPPPIASSTVEAPTYSTASNGVSRCRSSSKHADDTSEHPVHAAHFTGGGEHEVTTRHEHGCGSAGGVDSDGGIGVSPRKSGEKEDAAESDCVLLRQVDDFLLVTTNKVKAEAFVRIMHDRSKTGPWGFRVHEAKTVVNFEMMVDGASGEPAQKIREIVGTMFPWCGVRFDTMTCEVVGNYSRFSKSGVSESVTVESRRAGECLMARMKRFMSPKCHALLLDEGKFGLNSRQTVLFNVYEMMLVCAAKTAASALRLPRGPGANVGLLSNGALETTAYAYSLIQSRSNRRKGGYGTSKALRCVCKVHRFEVTWLGLHAFREVFGAYSIKNKGFARLKLDMNHALLQAERDTGKTSQRGAASGGESGSGGIENPCRSSAYARLRRVVRLPDALNLLQTLTAGG